HRRVGRLLSRLRGGALRRGGHSEVWLVRALLIAGVETSMIAASRAWLDAERGRLVRFDPFGAQRGSAAPAPAISIHGTRLPRPASPWATERQRAPPRRSGRRWPATR